MKKLFYLSFFLFAFANILQAQQQQSQIPKVNLENFTPPAKSDNKTKKLSKKDKRKDIPRVDLSKF